jgi:hypothetical protein
VKEAKEAKEGKKIEKLPSTSSGTNNPRAWAGKRYVKW